MKAKRQTKRHDDAIIDLRILATSDLHAALRAYDYFQDRESDSVGLTRVASLIAQARKEAPNNVLFENGDLVQGNPFGNTVAQTVAAGDAENPFFSALNHIGYDAATLGNHDFNFGLDYLKDAVSQANFPIVLANLARSKGATPDDDEPFLPPWVILERDLHGTDGAIHRVAIGVLGVTPPQVVDWDRNKVGRYLTARSGLETAKFHVPRMKAAGADLVVVLCHGGIGLEGEGPENIGAALADVSGIDAIVLGHVHAKFPAKRAKGPCPEGIDFPNGKLHGVPAVMPGAYGSHLGVIDLRLALQSSHECRVIDSRCALRPIAVRHEGGKISPLVSDNTDLLALSEHSHQSTLDDMRKVVGKSSAGLHSHFSYAGRDSAMQVVTRAMRRVTEKLAASIGLNGVPILAVSAPYRCGGMPGPKNYIDIPAGDIAMRDVAELHPFPDRLAVLGLTGRELRLWLEHASRAFNTIVPGSSDGLLINPQTPSYHFDTIDGLSYSIDLGQQPLDWQISDSPARIKDLRFNGQPLNDDAPFLLATNTYRAGGGGGYPNADASKIVLSVPNEIPDILREQIELNPEQPAALPLWTFANMPGTSVLLQTAPEAAQHLSELKQYHPEHAGTDARGFALFRLHL